MNLKAFDWPAASGPVLNLAPGILAAVTEIQTDTVAQWRNSAYAAWDLGAILPWRILKKTVRYLLRELCRIVVRLRWFVLGRDIHSLPPSPFARLLNL